MTKTQKNSLLIILISGIAVAILFNLKSFLWILEALESGTGDSEQQKFLPVKLQHGIISIIFHIIVFYVIAFFNYSWKDRLLPGGLSQPVRIILIMLSNAVVFYLFATLETSFAGLHLGNLKKLKNVFSAEYYLFLNLSTGVAAAVIGQLVLIIEHNRSTELENVQLRQEKAAAELAVLKEQISPHFFFNTLNSLSSVIRTENKAESLDFVEKMSEVYRYILDSESRDTVPLAEELAFVEAYTHLLIKRFGKSLSLTLNIDENLKQREVPPLALQVLMENVVKHNSLSIDKPITVSIVSGTGFVSVENNINTGKRNDGHGVGLANLNKRYRMIMGREIEIQSDKTRFLVKLPLK